MIKLGYNHSSWMMSAYNYYVIADPDDEDNLEPHIDTRISDREVDERIEWCEENLPLYSINGVKSWCYSSEVDAYGLCPYNVFYFLDEQDAMAFKMRWT